MKRYVETFVREEDGKVKIDTKILYLITQLKNTVVLLYKLNVIPLNAYTVSQPTPHVFNFCMVSSIPCFCLCLYACNIL